MTARKIIALFCSCLLLAGLMVALPSCGPNDKELIEQAVTTKYDSYKNADDQVLSNIISTLEDETLTTLGIDRQEFATVLVDGFDYHIDNITVNGDHAVVTITFAGKSYQDYYAMIRQAAASFADDPSFAVMSQEEKYDVVGQRLMEDFSNLDVIDETVDLDYELVDNKWQEADEQAGLEEINNILFLKPQA